MLVLLVVCLLKLIEMYTNNNKMARNKSARNAKENCFGLSKKLGMAGESFGKQPADDRYSMNYFYDIDQSCVDQLKEYLHHKSGNKSFMLSTPLGFRIPFELLVLELAFVLWFASFRKNRK